MALWLAGGSGVSVATSRSQPASQLASQPARPGRQQACQPVQLVRWVARCMPGRIKKRLPLCFLARRTRCPETWPMAATTGQQRERCMSRSEKVTPSVVVSLLSVCRESPAFGQKRWRHIGRCRRKLRAQREGRTSMDRSSPRWHCIFLCFAIYFQQWQTPPNVSQCHLSLPVVCYESSLKLNTKTSTRRRR